MKNWLIILFAVSVTSFSVSAQKANKYETLVVKTNIYCDHCMECGSCAGNINVAMAGLYGIKKAEIDAKGNFITVIYKPSKTNPAQIREAIAKAGFNADDVAAKPDAVAKLDGCCRKQ